MRRLHQIFAISATATISASALIFATAEGNALPALTLPLAVVALLTIDMPGRRGLPGVAAVLLCGGGLVAAFGEFFLGGLETRLLAPAHFLTYLTWIVTLQRKHFRQYWLLFGLSILQIAVAALLTTAAWFGLALILFVFLALWTLSSFTMYRAAWRIDAARDTESHAREKSFVTPGREVRGRSSVGSVRQIDSDNRIVGLRFAAGSVSTSVLSLMLAGLFFLYIPRVWLSQFRLFDNSALAAGLRPLTGFSEDVTLGDMGEILSNEDLVLEVQLFDADSGTRIPGEEYFDCFGSESPLFRGMTHEIYANGNWVHLSGLTYHRAPSRTNEPGLFRQTIRLQPTNSDILFVAGDARACIAPSRERRIAFNSATWMFRNSAEDAGTVEFTYTIASGPEGAGIASGFSNGVNYWAASETLHPGTEQVTQRALNIVMSELGLPSGAESEIPERLTPREIAQILTTYLRDSGKFQYTLSLAVDDPTVDPVEDFVFNRRRGHCEYFASTLAVMLRADAFAAPLGDGRGIPTRLVGGFKGGSFNSRTGWFEVRQLHAHSWVEVYLDGRWFPLDPTPPARDLSVANRERASSGGINRWTRRWENLWDGGMRLSKDEQQRLLFQPLEDTARETWRALRDVRGSSARLGEFLRSLSESPERWFSWRGGVTVFVLMTFVTITVRLLRKLAGVLRHSRRMTRRLRRGRTAVPFFDRFTRIVNRLGLRREDDQTQLEFARQVEGQLATSLRVPATADLPQEITETYYQVRFGDHPISPDEAAALDDRLDALEEALREAGSKRDRRH